jgi:hypothetical protein
VYYLIHDGGKKICRHVWVQEWFGQDAPPRFRVNQKDRPWGAIVEFSGSVTESQRDRAMLFNAKCFVQFSGCKAAEDILPGVWQMGTPMSGYVWPSSTNRLASNTTSSAEKSTSLQDVVAGPALFERHQQLLDGAQAAHNV